MTNELSKQPKPGMPQSVKSLLASDYFKKQVELCLPKHLTADRFMRVALTAVTRIPKLADCTPASVIKCMMACSELGIEPDGRRAHLIPYGQECQLVIDYKGLVELAKRSGDVSSIYAMTVCENDHFTWDTGVVKHNINWREDRGQMYAVYAVITFKDGGKHTEVMTKTDVDRIRARSKAGKNGPWVTDYDEMAKKTVFRRASKWIVLSPEIHDALDKESDAPLNRISSLVTEAPFQAWPEPEPDAAAPVEADLPQADAKPERILTVQDTLAEIVIESKFDFDDFAAWAKSSGNLPNADNVDSFSEVPTEIARRLTRNVKGMLAGIAKEKQPEIVP